jgi:hypothetical protein
VPPEYQSEFAGVMADFAARKDNPAILVPAFNISHPYKFLNAGEVSQFIEIRSLRRTSDASPGDVLWKTADLYRLTDVYFNSTHTFALTAISTFFGGLCGMSSWKVFQKTNEGSWKERPWITCASMA